MKTAQKHQGRTKTKEPDLEQEELGKCQPDREDELDVAPGFDNGAGTPAQGPQACQRCADTRAGPVQYSSKVAMAQRYRGWYERISNPLR